ncbi:MAG TPA: family 3 adenylate cyclase [Blastocatellia bacterium]
MTNISGKDRFLPELFDLAQDITGGLPLQVIGQWVSGVQNQETALRLLAPHKVTGYSVSSDTAGLTKLTRQLGLMEILAIINRPKEIVYELGTAIGGQALGIWAADNTQMFYPPSTNAAMLLSALLSAQDKVNQVCQVKIGLGAHYDEFYSLSGGLYGAAADAIEEWTKDQTEGGEIVVTEGICQRLPPDHDFTLVRRGDSPILGAIFRVIDGPRRTDAPATTARYPIPYSESFYEDLLAYQNHLGDTALGQRLADKYLQNKVVVYIERENFAAETYEMALCNNLSLSAILKDTGLRLLPKATGLEVKVAGPLGIYIFDEAGEAVNFALAFRNSLAQEDVACRIGIDAGPVLVFKLPTGGRDIAGMPVNIASKMAHDKGQMGKLYLSAAVKELVEDIPFTELKYTVSGVEIDAYEG